MTTRFSNGPEKKSTTKKTTVKDRSRVRYENDHFQSLVKEVPVVLWEAPHDAFQYSYVSPEAERMFGYTQEECLEPDFLEKLIPPEEREFVKEYTRLAVQENHTYQIEYHIITKKGKVKTLRDTVRLIWKEGKPYKKVGATVDISVYSQTMHELEISNRKFFNAFYNFPIPAAIFRIPDGKCIDVNKNFLQVSGIERKEIIGKTPLEVDVWVNTEDREFFIEQLKRNVTLEKFPVLLKDGFSRLRNVLVSAERFDHNGQGSMLLMFYDVTEQIKIEQRLQQTNRELETFMYKSSHNLKGPVASIKGLLYLLGRGITDPQSKQYLELMEQSAQGLESTLEELMDVTRLKQGTLKIEMVDLKMMLEDIKNKLKFMPQWKKIHYKVTVQKTYPLYSDRCLLHSIMQNLVENAVKYKEENKETIIEVRAVVRHKEVQIFVKDNAIGIPEEQQGRVFEMFYRAHHKASGSGLGLYIVRNSVEKLGGKISLKSRPAEGSVFKVSIPNFSQMQGG